MVSKRNFMPVLALMLAVIPGWSAVDGPNLETAWKLYHSTEFEKSLQVLQAIQQKDGSIHELIGRNYYMLGDYKKATEAMEKAVSAEPGSSSHALWLGRAYGRRAETSSPFTAPGLASKARQGFEKAVQLNPSNSDALDDLFEYYLEAPGFLGGGYDKAAATAARIAALNPAEGHWALAKLAEKKKEYNTAEQHLQRAVENAPQQAGRLLDLARFLTSRGRYQEAEQRFAQADKVAPDSAKVLYARADAYIKSNRNLDLARELLKRYLNLPLTAEDPPRSEAVRLLRQIQGG